MLAKALLQYHVDGDRVVPHWLDAGDGPWIAEILEVFDDHMGQPWGQWRDRKRRGWTVSAPQGKRAMALAVLERSARGAKLEGCHPREVRRAVFEAAEATRCEEDGRRSALEAAARALDLSAEQVERLLFADAPAERIMELREPLPDLPALIDRVNLALVQGLLRQSVRVELALRGNARAVVRQILLRRLIAVARAEGADGVRIEISGVYDLFRRTTLYGRALASIIPILAWCPRYRLEAELSLQGRAAHLVLTDARRFPSARRPAAYDSKLEERFARDVRKQLPEWELVREPVPIEVDGTLVFPDFELRHRSDPVRRALVEIVGFWTEDYLATKTGRLERAGRSDLILCVDEQRCTTARELAPSLRVVPFCKRIDPHLVVEAIGRCEPMHSIETRQVEIRDLFIDFAGRRPPTDPIHDALEVVQPGDAVELVPSARGVAIEHGGRVVARLGRGGRERHGVSLRTRATVRRKVLRMATSSAPRYRALLRCPRWWLLEVEYAAPGASR